MKIRTLAAAALAATGFFFATQCLAQPYAGFSVGQADVDESMVIPALIDPGGNVDGKDGAFKLFGGYQFNRNFALEAAFVDLGDGCYSGNFTGTPPLTGPVTGRSEERRVGKEWRSRWAPQHEEKKVAEGGTWTA